MLEIILSALALGFSTGISCIIACAPFYIPYLIAEKREFKINFWEFVKLMFGRLSGYLLFGLIAGYLGEKLNVGWINVFSSISLGILAFFIILYSLIFFKSKFHNLACAIGSKKIKPPFLIGFLTGFNLCPPFLLSLNYVFILGDVIMGLLFFFFFFVATNFYFIPLVFLGKLSYLHEFRTFARWTLLVVGLIFFLYSIYNLITNQNLVHYVPLLN